MKVAIIMPLAEQRGGAEMTLWHLMERGRHQGIDWTLIFFEDGPMIPQIQSLGISTHIIPSGRLRSPIRFISAVFRIALLLRRERIDLVCNWMTQTHLYGGLAAIFAGKFVTWFQHSTSSPTNLIDRAAALIPTRAILVVSRHCEKAQQRLWPARTIHVINPGVELENFDSTCLPSPHELRHRLGLPSTGPLIGIVGRLQRWKGIHVLVEAMSEVLRSHPDASCVIVGGEHTLEPGYLEFLKQRITSLNLQNHVFLTGLQRNIPEWMQAMDIMVHASQREPFGLVVIEAMALGKPVVAGDEAGPSEIITDGVNGLLSPYGDSSRLAKALLRYLNDPVFASNVGAAARERARNFSTKIYAQKLVATLHMIAIDKPDRSKIRQTL